MCERFCFLLQNYVTFFARDSDIHIQANREMFLNAGTKKLVPSDLKRYKSSIEN